MDLVPLPRVEPDFGPVWLVAQAARPRVGWLVRL